MGEAAHVNSTAVSQSLATSALRHQWFVVARSDDLLDTPLAVTLLETPIVVWRGPDQTVIAAADRCPHREAPLSAGTLTDGCLRCPYHGWSFGNSGTCVAIASSGPDAAIPPTARLGIFRAEEHYGLIWVNLGTPTSPVPMIEAESDADYTRLNTSVQTWSCSSTRMVDNMVDVAHFPFTHAGTFGREQEQQVPHITLEQLDDTFYGYRYSVVVNNEGEAKAMSGEGEDVIGIDMSTGFALPYSVRSTMSYENGIEQVLFMTASPVSRAHSLYTFVLWRNDDVTHTGQGIVDFELEVTAEDKAMLERVPGELTLQHGGLVDVQSDKASVEWRRRYRELLARS